MKSDLTINQIDLLIVVQLKVNRAVLAKFPDGLTGLRVQGNQAIAWRHIQNPLFLAVRPISDAMTRKCPGCGCPTGAFVLAVHPEKFSCSSIECDHSSS